MNLTMFQYSRPVRGDSMKELIPVEIIERKIYLIRGEKVMLDSDLAALYGVETFNLNKGVKRNKERYTSGNQEKGEDWLWEGERLSSFRSRIK